MGNSEISSPMWVYVCDSENARNSRRDDAEGEIGTRRRLWLTLTGPTTRKRVNVVLCTRSNALGWVPACTKPALRPKSVSACPGPRSRRFGKVCFLPTALALALADFMH